METLTKLASAGEGTSEQVPVYSTVCHLCTWQSLWHSDEGKADAALSRHIAAKHYAPSGAVIGPQP